MAIKAKDIFSELRAITKPTYRDKINNFMIADTKSRLVGNGYEIHNIRKWQPGDPLEHIDLEASLATWPKELYILEMFETKSSPVIFIADISPSIFVRIDQGGGKLKLLLQLMGAIGLGANRLSNPVGVMCFSDKVETYMPPKLGPSWLYYMINVLCSKAMVEERPSFKKNIKQAFNLNSVLKFLVARLSLKKCSIIILSDFTDFIGGQAEFDLKILKILSFVNNFNVICIFLDEPEEFLWARGFGTVAVLNAETGRVEEVKASDAGKVRGRFVEKREDLRRQLEKIGIDSVVVSYGNHFNDVAQFLSERQAKSV
ncbi:MAG: DUF58 domain-containing protein [Patescibacteria group bacterium]